MISDDLFSQTQLSQLKLATVSQTKTYLPLVHTLTMFDANFG